jgi:stearoyl-CoA desaturase (delta-9 desaturase)
LAFFLFHLLGYIFLNASINSLCHMLGYRNFDNWRRISGRSPDHRRRRFVHNNHHEFPSAARFSMRPGEFDPAWLFIRMMEMMGLAKVKRLPIAKAA